MCAAIDNASEHDCQPTSQPESSPASGEVANTRRAASYTIEQCRTTTQRILSVSLAAVGLSHRAAADLCGVSRTIVDAWCGSGMPRSVSLSRLLVLAETSRRGREAAIAVLSGALSHIQDHVTFYERDLRSLIDDVHADVGDLSVLWREAMADGHVSPAEAKALSERVVAVERTLAALRNELGRVQT